MPLPEADGVRSRIAGRVAFAGNVVEVYHRRFRNWRRSEPFATLVETTRFRSRESERTSVSRRSSARSENGREGRRRDPRDPPGLIDRLLIASRSRPGASEDRRSESRRSAITSTTRPWRTRHDSGRRGGMPPFEHSRGDSSALSWRRRDHPRIFPADAGPGYFSIRRGPSASAPSPKSSEDSFALVLERSSVPRTGSRQTAASSYRTSSGLLRGAWYERSVRTGRRRTATCTGSTRRRARRP